MRMRTEFAHAERESAGAPMAATKAVEVLNQQLSQLENARSAARKIL
jgi:hypothetical protein